MSISLRIQWISLIAFTCSSLLIRDRLVASVPPANYAVQSLLSQPFILFWLAWLVWYSFGPGRRRPRGAAGPGSRPTAVIMAPSLP